MCDRSCVGCSPGTLTLIIQIELEKSLMELEAIVQKLEAGDLSLEDSLKQFEEGVSHYKACKEWLSTAEKRVQVLTESLKTEELADE